MDIGTPQVNSKVIVIPNGEAMRVTTEAFEFTSGVPIPLGTSEDYINVIVFNSNQFLKFR